MAKFELKYGQAGREGVIIVEAENGDAADAKVRESGFQGVEWSGSYDGEYVEPQLLSAGAAKEEKESQTPPSVSQGDSGIVAPKNPK